MFDSVSFGKRLKYLRESRGMTQEVLAQALHIGTNQEYRLESGRRSPTIDLCIALSSYFDVSLDFIISGTTSKASTPRQIVCETIYTLMELEQLLTHSSSNLEENHAKLPVTK